MAKLFFFLFLAITATADQTDDGFLQSEKLAPLPTARQEKVSHFRFYFHDIVGGRNPTAVSIARAATTNASSTLFGVVFMFDDPLTVGPEVSSRLVGRAQGLYGSAQQESWALLMAMNFAFLEGKYNGSALTILGRNPGLTGTKEMPVVGGSGLFRFARGYVQARTHSYNSKTGDATVRYDVFVIHF